MHAQRLRPPTAQAFGRGLSPLGLALAAALAMGLAYAVVLAQPNLVHGLRGALGPLQGAGGSASWTLPVAAAGIAVAGGAIGVFVLSALARLAQRNPYLWLGPVLVAFTMIVLAGVQARLPWPALGLPAFAALSGVAMLCGGAVLQVPGRAGRVAGALLLALPLFALLAGYAATPAGLAASLAADGRAAALVSVILILTAAGLAATALVGRAEDLEAVARMRETIEHQRLQLIDALELGRASEARVWEAERRMELLEHRIPAPSPSLSDEEALLAMRGSQGSAMQWALGAAAVLLATSCAVLYFGLYRPAAVKLQAQRAQLLEVDQAHGAELAALRADFEVKQTGFATQLDAERSQRATERSALAEAQSKLAACAPVAAEPAAAAAEPEVKPSSKRKVARAKRRAAARKVAKPVAPAASADEPGLDRQSRRVLRDAVSADDDPIGGL